MSNNINNLFRNKNSLNRAGLIIKIIEFCSDSPISTRQISAILNIDNKTVRYYLNKLKNFVEKKYNLGFVLTSKGRHLANKIGIRLNPKIIQTLSKIKRSRYYHNIVHTEWKKIIKKHNKDLKDTNLFFHWYNLPDNFTLKVNIKKFRTFLNKLESKLNIKSDRQFALKLGYNEKLIWRYKKGMDHPSVRSVKKICNFAKMPYEDLEKYKIFKENFPIKINKYILQLRTHLINEGNLNEDSSLYHNYDPVLLKNFQNCIKKIKRRVYHPRLTEKDIYILTDKFTSWLINFTDVNFGKTSKSNPRLHILQRNNFNFFKEHMAITLAEEGILFLNLHKKHKNLYVDYHIGLGRAVDVSNLLPSFYKNKLNHGFLMFPKLPENIQHILCKQRCKLLDDEISILYKFLKLPCYRFIPKPLGIYKTKKGNISLYWSWNTQNREIIERVYNMVIQNSWAHRKAMEYYKIWSRLFSKQLSKQDIKEVDKIVHIYNRRGVPNFWIKEHMKKYFPSIEIDKENFPIR